MSDHPHLHLEVFRPASICTVKVTYFVPLLDLPEYKLRREGMLQDLSETNLDPNMRLYQINVSYAKFNEVLLDEFGGLWYPELQINQRGYASRLF